MAVALAHSHKILARAQSSGSAAQTHTGIGETHKALTFSYSETFFDTGMISGVGTHKALALAQGH